MSRVYYCILVGGFNPFEKYARQNGNHFPRVRGENKKCLKPPGSILLYTSVPEYFF